MPESPLNLHIDVVETEIRLGLESRMLGADGSRQVTEAIEHAFEPRGANSLTLVRIDLARVVLMASSAIGALIVLHKRLARKGCRLELDNPTPAVREALEFLKLDSLLTISSAS